MKRKFYLILSISAFLAATGCIKETYNMDNLSKRVHLSPVFGVSAVRGEISISDLKNIPNDTVVFDEDNFIRLVFTKDSVINLDIGDFDGFDNLAEFHLNEVYSVTGTAINLKDTVTFTPGNDIEIVQIKVNSGTVNYQVRSQSLASATFRLTLPTVLRGGLPVTQNIAVPANATVTGSVSIANTDVDLSKDPDMSFNRLPLEYSFTATSGVFGPADKMYVQVDIPTPDYDFIKGYFGKQTESDEDTLDLGIKDLLDHISGDFLLSSPSIKLDYYNSFSIPVQVDLQATGYKMSETIPLGLDPFMLAYPAAPAERDKTGTITIDKSNSDLPELVSMPPEKIHFTGSAFMNPDGNTGARDNYLFKNSRFLGNMEIEVPLEFRMGNLQLTDTTENFLKMDESSDSPVNTEDFEFLRIDLEAENGFPLGIGLSMILFDTLTSHNIDTVDASTFLEAASVDSNGKVTGPRGCSTSIEIDRKFWSSIDAADRIIFTFTLTSSEGGTKDVKIYADYKIKFKASLVLKPDFKFDLN